MRMFLSVSEHSSEISIANHSLRSTVLQLKCVSDTTSSWFENHQSQKTKVTIVIYAPFIQNSNQVASSHKFSEGIFSTPVILKATCKVFLLTGLLRWQKLTWFFQHFLQDAWQPMKLLHFVSLIYHVKWLFFEQIRGKRPVFALCWNILK